MSQEQEREREGGRERERPTRRNAIRRGLLAAGGLVGLGAGARAAAGASRSMLEAPSATLTLFAPDLETPPARPGEGPAARFDLLDAPAGRPAGEMHVAIMPVLGPGASSPDAGAMEWHTFRLRGGTILGAGSAGTEGGAFAVVGGTGRFANARGTYELRRLAAGGAQFVLRLEP